MISITMISMDKNLPSMTRLDHVIMIMLFSTGCSSTGGHYNPFNKTHGGPFDKIRQDIHTAVFSR